MQVENTELEYTEEDEIVLDYEMHGETLTAWAQRVWADYPHTWEPNAGAFWFWENKKRRRRAAIVSKFNGSKVGEEYFSSIAERVNGEYQPVVADNPAEVTDAVIQAIKLDERYVIEE